jgi:hypothetical protein
MRTTPRKTIQSDTTLPLSVQKGLGTCGNMGQKVTSLPTPLPSPSDFYLSPLPSLPLISVGDEFGLEDVEEDYIYSSETSHLLPVPPSPRLSSPFSLLPHSMAMVGRTGSCI